MTSLILGAGGRLGRALLSQTAGERIERAAYAEWWREGAEREVAQLLSSAGNGVVYVASGLIDPRLSAEDHHRVNFLLSRNVVEGAAIAGWRAVTLGTIMELIQGTAESGAYVSSKLRLGDHVRDACRRGANAVHVRLHTLYGGGLPASFMFLGQVLHALVHGREFHMSAGNQLREYHHIDDDAAALIRFAAGTQRGCLELSHGQPVTLRLLASNIFGAFGRSELLRIAALPTPSKDNFDRVYPRTPGLEEVRFREPLAGVTDYLNECALMLGIRA